MEPIAPRRALVGALTLLGLAAAPARAEAPPPPAAAAPCEDPAHAQYRARIADLLRVEEQVEAWEEFLRMFPQSPCADEARRELEALRASSERRAEAAREESWRQQARGGIIEPGHLAFPAHAGMLDASPGYRVRLTTELIVLDSFHGLQARVDDVLWTQVLRAEVALIPWIGLRVEIPAVLGTHRGGSADYALGNIMLGLRGHWGTYLRGEDELPLLISGGFLWGSGSSDLSGHDRRGLLEAAAFGSPSARHRFAFDARDYAGHAEGQLRVAPDHFLSLGLQYHVYSGGEQVEKIFTYDLAYDWLVAGCVYLGLELNGGAGLMPDVDTDSANAWRAWVLLSPQARLDLGMWELGLAVRVPLGAAADWSSVIVGLELAAELGPPASW